MFKPSSLPGAAPCQVIVNAAVGTDPAVVRQQYAEALGAINHFYSAARQSLALSGQTIHNMQADIPGGHVRYTYNNGIELVRVTLSAPESPTEAPERPEDIHNLDPVLLIDVVFEPAFYLTGDIYSFIPATPDGGDLPPHNGDPSTWTITVITTQSTFETALHAYEEDSLPPGWVLDSVDFGSSTTSSWDGWLNFKTTSHSVPGLPDSPVGSATSGGYGNTGPPFLSGYAQDLIYYPAIRVKSHQPVFPFGSADGTFPQRVILTTYVAPGYPPGPGGGPTPGTPQKNKRDKYSYFDAVNVVGLIGSPDKNPYAAISTGDTTDHRLKPLLTEAAKISVTRAVTPDSVPPGPTGAGFSATPVSPAATTNIDVYVAAMNTIKSNVFPGLENSTFAADDSGMSYDTKKDLMIRITARELMMGERPYIVRVAPTMSKRTEHFDAPSDGAGVPPTTSAGQIDSADGRDHSWSFGAQSGWTDAGGSPADASNDKMGKLLADSGALSVTGAGPPGPPRKVFDSPDWTYGVPSMTLVARIEWKPPRAPGEHGTATITPA